MRSVRVCLGVARLFQFLFVSAILLFACAPAFSQGTAGRIVGTITDQSGGSIGGATVTILDVARGTTRTLTTEDSGSYNAPNLLPGTYKVRAEFKGFKITERQNIILEVGQEIRVDLALQPGEQAQTITVTEQLPLVETTNAELGGTLNSDIVNNLPMNGRNFANLLQLRPGVTIYPGGSGWTQSTNGLRAHDNVYMVDGINSNDPWMAQAVWDSVMASGDTGTLISIDAIDEFKTQENPRAEYGWKPGGVVNVGIKSGTNAFHGTGYAYGRLGSWDALNVFDAPPNPVPSISLEQYGGTFGGPIVKDKLFFFLTYEEQQYALGSTQIINEAITAPGIFNPTSNLIASNLLGGCQAALDIGTIGSGTPGALTALSAQLAGITVGAPAAGHPNGTCTQGPNYPGLFPVDPGTAANPQQIGNGLVNNNTIHSGLVKVDYRLNDQHSINGSYFISPGAGIVNDSPAQTNVLFETNQYARSMGFAGNWTWTPNSTVVNEARVGYAHYFQQFLSNDAAQDPRNYSFNGHTYNYFSGQTNPLYFGFPAITIFGLNGPMGASWPKIVGPDGILQVLDHVSVLHGNHAFKFGGEIISNQSTSDVTANAKGPIRFSSIKDFFQGMPNGVPTPVNNKLKLPDNHGSATILTGDLLRHFSFSGYALFMQDDWRVNPRLTVNLGLRYEINTVPKERNDEQGNFDPNSPTGIVQVGAGSTSVYNGDHNNFAPRLGAAWDVFGNGKTVVRAGAGVFYEQLSLDVFNGIGNSFGLRTAPSGATEVFCSVAVAPGGTCGTAPNTGSAVVRPGPGNIGVINTVFTGTPIINGVAGQSAGTYNGLAQGGIPFNWINNGPSTSVFTFQPYCGDGFTALPSGPLAGFTPQQCNVMGVSPNLRTPYVYEYSLGIQRAITSTISFDIGYVGNTGRKFISALDINQPGLVGGFSPAWGNPAVGGTAAATCLASAPSYGSCTPNNLLLQGARPFNSKFPYFKYIDSYGNFDTSNYNSLQTTLTMRNFHGLTLTGGYTYSHSLGVASDQGTGGGNFIPIDSTRSIHDQLYGPSSFDIQHRGTISGTYNIPGVKGFGQALQGWSINAVAIIQSGLPWGVSDASTDFAGTGEFTGNTAANQGGQWDFFGNPRDFEANHNFTGVTPGPTGQVGIPYFPGLGPTGGTLTANAACNAKAAALGPLAMASLSNLGCYALGSSVLIPPGYGSYGTTSRNMFRDHGYRNMDLSITKAFKFKERLTAQFRAEFFNILNHPNFVNPAGGPGGGGASLDPSAAGGSTGLGYVSNTPDIASSNPVLGSGGPRAMQLGLKLIF
jgi:Carboxypeptidase regulatory-like domain/TonB dependent receptor